MLLPRVGRRVGPGIECLKEGCLRRSVGSTPSSKLFSFSFLMRWIVALSWINCRVRYLSWCRISDNSFLIHNKASSKRACRSALVPSEFIIGAESSWSRGISTWLCVPDLSIFHVHTFMYGKECRLVNCRWSESISPQVLVGPRKDKLGGQVKPSLCSLLPSPVRGFRFTKLPFVLCCCL